MNSNDGDLNLKQLFEGMMICEKKAAEFYDFLSHGFADIEEASALWMQMRDDEFTHVNMLQSLLSKLGKAQLSQAVGAYIHKKLLAVSRMLDSDLIGSVGNLEQAYELAHQLESSELNAIFSFLVVETVSAEDRKRLIRLQVDEHVDRLYDFGRKYKGTAVMYAAPILKT